jgi:hypothetical protein
MAPRFDTHFNVIGVCHLILGLLSLVAGLGALAVLGVFGALITGAAAVDAGTSGLADGGVFSTIAMFFATAIAAVSVPQIAAGFGLLKRRPWAPAVALFVSLFHLFTPPFGTALAVYTGWSLLSEQGQRDYKLISG